MSRIHRPGVLFLVIVHVAHIGLCKKPHDKLAESALRLLVTPLRLLYICSCLFLGVEDNVAPTTMTPEPQGPIETNPGEVRLSPTLRTRIRHPCLRDVRLSPTLFARDSALNQTRIPARHHPTPTCNPRTRSLVSIPKRRHATLGLSLLPASTR